MSGQINRDSEIGQKIYELAKHQDIRTIVDIGTWNGLGSTKCIIDGWKDSSKWILSSPSLVMSIEANYDRYLEAQKNLKDDLWIVDLVFGRITIEEDLINLDNYPDRFFTTYSREQQKEWFKESIREHKESPIALNKIPHEIDLLILDGGEYCSKAEFFILKGRSKIIVLDDTETLKNYDAAEYIRANSEEFEILIDNKNSRNGYLIGRNLKR
jgi:hypothetical protein